MVCSHFFANFAPCSSTTACADSMDAVKTQTGGRAGKEMHKYDVTNVINFGYLSMYKRNLILLCAVFSFAVTWSKEKTEELPPYTGTYWIEFFSSMKDAHNQAVELAIEDALAERYGIFTDTKNYSDAVSVEGLQTSNFINSAVSMPKGQLVKLLESGNFKDEFAEDKLKVTVTVRILAKEKKPGILIESKILRHEDDLHETLRYTHNDPFYLSFCSPVDGYLAVYLEDENHEVYNLLPYSDDAQGSVPVIHNKNYLFFCDDKSFFKRNKTYVKPEDFNLVQRLCLQTSDMAIANRLYILFSPNKFSRKVAEVRNQLPVLTSFQFQQWLGTMRMDDDFVDERKVIVISPKNKM